MLFFRRFLLASEQQRRVLRRKRFIPGFPAFFGFPHSLVRTGLSFRRVAHTLLRVGNLSLPFRETCENPVFVAVETIPPGDEFFKGIVPQDAVQFRPLAFDMLVERRPFFEEILDIRLLGFSEGRRQLPDETFRLRDLFAGFLGRIARPERADAPERLHVDADFRSALHSRGLSRLKCDTFLRTSGLHPAGTGNRRLDFERNER